MTLGGYVAYKKGSKREEKYRTKIERKIMEKKREEEREEFEALRERFCYIFKFFFNL